ncbi:hypothetical protein D3C83_21400 [compost metagenome]
MALSGRSSSIVREPRVWLMRPITCGCGPSVSSAISMKSSRPRSEASLKPPPGVNTVKANPSDFNAPATWRATGMATSSRNVA